MFTNRGLPSFTYGRDPNKPLEHSLLRLLIRLLRFISSPIHGNPHVPINIAYYFSLSRRQAGREPLDQARNFCRVQELIGTLGLVLFVTHAFSPPALAADIIRVVEGALPKDGGFFVFLKVIYFYFLRLNCCRH